ncbi:MAG: 2-phosphosulfolactate phosphatase [Planctomycetota bacterium]
MKIDLSFTPFGPGLTKQTGKRVVVIDVLRACSTMIHALARGCKDIYPCATVGDARRLFGQKVKELSRDAVLLGGERGGTKVKGFHLGNSPGEYSTGVVGGKTIVFTTSNCTRNLAFIKGKGAKEVLICSFTNLPAVAERLAGDDTDLLLSLSGTDGQMSLEDAVCGGMLVDALRKRPGIVLSDSSRTAYILYANYRRNIRRALLDSNHGRRLLELGFRDDISSCSRVGRYRLIPTYVRGRVTAARA